MSLRRWKAVGTWLDLVNKYFISFYYVPGTVTRFLVLAFLFFANINSFNSHVNCRVKRTCPSELQLQGNLAPNRNPRPGDKNIPSWRLFLKGLWVRFVGCITKSHLPSPTGASGNRIIVGCKKAWDKHGQLKSLHEELTFTFCAIPSVSGIIALLPPPQTCTIYLLFDVA